MSQAIRYPRGSQWRRWDLHVHTPFSALNNGFGADFDIYAQQLIERAVAAEIAVVGITDYFGIPGYRALKELIADPTRLVALVGDELAAAVPDIRFLPNIELRARELVQSGGGDSRVNFHVILSDELSLETIEEHFLRELKFTAQSTPGGPDEEWSLTMTNLGELGKRLKAEHAPFQGQSDLFIGMMNAVVTHENVTKALATDRFKDRYLIVVSADEDLSAVPWDGQGHQTRKLFLQKAQMLFSANPNTRDFALGRRHPSVKDFENEFRSRKPCIHGSDAHSYETLFSPAQDRMLWIKADPTFQGLRQLLHEPADRVFIGDQPPSIRHVAENSTRYLNSLVLERTDRASATEEWFSGEIPLNHGLIALIGRKGSGKSALADILGLLGDSRLIDHFSFLTKSRFLSVKGGLGAMFRGTLQWVSGQGESRLLGDPTNPANPERVKYIPQGYLEKLCAEPDPTSAAAFRNELEDVIFSHVEPADRLGQQSLPELIQYRTSETDAAIMRLLSRLADVNRDIVSLQTNLSPTHRKTLEADFSQRLRELQAHRAARPVVVAPPGVVDQSGDEPGTALELSQVVDEIETLDKTILAAQEDLDRRSRRRAAAERLLKRVENLRHTFDDFHQESRMDADLLGVDTRSIVKLTLATQELDATITTEASEIADLRTVLDPDNPESLRAKRGTASARAVELRQQLDAPARRHQEYLQQAATWKKRQAELIGHGDTPDSLLGRRAQLRQLDVLPAKLKTLEASRADTMRQIFQLKEELLQEYRRLYSPVQAFIERHPVSREMDALEFSAAMSVGGLADQLLEMIHQGRRGSFQGDKEGRERLESLIERHSFSTIDEVEAFLAEFMSNVAQDVRSDGVVVATNLADQLRKEYDPEDFLNYVFGLSYLRPQFALLWRGKPLDKLSPGERGTLLLVFYLCIDRRRGPLIIDQPEENLDNETITRFLVPAIKYAKEVRQIVLVTHNPNLAVVCDADQIVHAQIDKSDGNRITYVAGSIEEPRITQLLVDVLEGTKPAFDLRDDRYEVLEARP